MSEYANDYDSRFIRLAGKIADFGHPIYSEERSRDVWNAASAFGLQVTIWGVWLAAPAMVWVGGWTAIPYALTMLVILGVSGWLTVAYAHRLGVAGAALKVSRRRGRFAVLATVYLLFLAGLGRAAWPRLGHITGSGIAGLWVGFTLALVTALTIFLVVRRRDARRQARAEQADQAELAEFAAGRTASRGASTTPAGTDPTAG